MKTTKLLRDLKLAGLLTENRQITKEQEIQLLKNRINELVSLNEIEFRNQKEFDSYHKAHKLRPTTKVKIAGKTTTAGAAAGGDVSKKAPKGTNVFNTSPAKPKGTKVSGGGADKKKSTYHGYGSKPGPDFKIKTQQDWDDLNKVLGGDLDEPRPDGKPISNAGTGAIKNVDSLSNTATSNAIHKALGGKLEMGFDTNSKGKEYAQLIDANTGATAYELHDMPGGGIKVLDVQSGKYVGKAKDTKDLMQILPKLNTSSEKGKSAPQSTAIKNVDSLSDRATSNAIQKATDGKFEMGFDTNSKGREYAQLIDPETNMAFYELHDMPGGGIKVLDVYAGKYVGKAKDTKDLMQILPKLNRKSYEKDFPDEKN